MRLLELAEALTGNAHRVDNVGEIQPDWIENTNPVWNYLWHVN